MIDTHAHMIVLTPGGCWIWIGCQTSNGYAQVGIHGRTRRAARFAKEQQLGRQIDTGLHVDHLCRQKLCVNPDHLEVVTPKENNHRGYLTGDPTVDAIIRRTLP